MPFGDLVKRPLQFGNVVGNVLHPQNYEVQSKSHSPPFLAFPFDVIQYPPNVTTTQLQRQVYRHYLTTNILLINKLITVGIIPNK